jgi:hypothetical protein
MSILKAYSMFASLDSKTKEFGSFSLFSLEERLEPIRQFTCVQLLEARHQGPAGQK